MKKEAKIGSVARLSINSLLPVKPSNLALDVRREQLELFDLQYLSTSEMWDRLEQLEQETPRADANARNVLVRNHSGVALVHSKDAFEELKDKLGLAGLREELEVELVQKVNFEEGLKVFNQKCKKILGFECNNMKDVGKYFPHLTRLDIAFLAWVKRAPESFFVYGTQYDPAKYDIEYQGKVWFQIPVLLGCTVDTLVFANESYNEEILRTGLGALDAFEYMGVTGRHDLLEYISLTPEVKQIFQNLVPLLVTNQRLHDRVWYASKDATSVGFGKVARTVLIKLTGEEQEAPLKQSIDKLPPQKRQEFEVLRSLMEKKIFRGVIYDLGRNDELRKDELFRLVGMLKGIPNCLIGEDPFMGYISPYGMGVKFIDHQGKFLEYVPYSDWYIREALVQFHSETITMETNNQIILEMFERVKSQCELDTWQFLVDSPTECSLLENIQLDVYLRHSIRLEIMPKQHFLEIRNLDQLLSGGITPNNYHIKHSQKFSLHEAHAVSRLLRLIPYQFLGGIKHILKFTTKLLTIRELMGGTIIYGQYLPEIKTICLYEPVDESYLKLSEQERAVAGFTFVHEVGESIWQTLSEREKEQWRKISWSRVVRRKSSHFLTWYSQAMDERDDFCDHFACYILHGSEFKEKARKAQALGKKYKFLSRLFFKRTKRVITYGNFYPWTILELHGAIERRIEERALYEAYKVQIEEIEAEQEKAKEKIRQKVSSFEDLVEAEYKEHEETYEDWN